jgi:hypothetical protein
MEGLPVRNGGLKDGFGRKGNVIRADSELNASPGRGMMASESSVNMLQFQP